MDKLHRKMWGNLGQSLQQPTTSFYPSTVPGLAPISYGSQTSSLLQPVETSRSHPLLDSDRLFQLSVSNPLKHCRLEQFTNEVKQHCFSIELKHENMQRLQSCIHASMKTMEQDLEQLRAHSIECARLSENVSSKQQRTKGLIEQVIIDNHENLSLYEEAQREWQLLKSSSSTAIEIPSSFFINLEQMFARRLEKYRGRIAEVEELVTIQMQAKEAELEATPELLFEILQNMNESLLLIAASVCEVKEILGALKVRFIQLAREKTGRTEAELAQLFRMPPSEFSEIAAPPLSSEALGKRFGDKPLAEQDKFYQDLISGPSIGGTMKYI
eukprot:TRINITY_DN6446_c0_g1_i2.p1 TRINITY_DN6446_c0_g1~~TRINITY_DN6446_c0_g1_i2.p1  ORF type:complete len:328 (-),score=83.81 TRINITY_DN6446_c0_g1_i2:104-1087(-)